MVRAMILTAFLIGGAMAALANAPGPLTGSIDARKVIRKDSGREVFVPATEALPNDVIEYRLTYANNSEEPVRNVSVTDPIPAGTNYVSLSATRPQQGAVEFSIDEGRNYQNWPVRYQVTLDDGSKEWREATPEMVTHIRWTISGAFAPESEITLSYRAIVK